MCPLTKVDEKLVQMVLHEYSECVLVLCINDAHCVTDCLFAEIFNAEILFREDCSPDELIDVILKNRVYLPCLYIYNKIDQISLEEVDKLARRPHSVVVSCNMKLNLDYMLEMIWDYLALIQVYTKKRGGIFLFLAYESTN